MESYRSALKALSSSTSLIKAGRDRSHSKSRTPDYTAPSYASSRPQSDRGVTFHFQHKTISKGKDFTFIKDGLTPASGHQHYIERLSAAEHSNPEITTTLLTQSTRNDRQPSPMLHDGFAHPRRHVDPQRISFGTTGSTKAKRKEFWRDIESTEARRARVQSRLIIELPFELPAIKRAALTRDFCAEVFETRALPYWTVLHAPSRKNDERNFHLHIAYFDRPAGTNSDGEWDFAIYKTKLYKHRIKRSVRPFVNKKHPDVRSIHWIKTMRETFAEIANNYLAEAGLEKRYDPRSYKASGIDKEPTEHLGLIQSYLEKKGVDTYRGTRNAKREIRWRLIQAEDPWVKRFEKAMSHPAIKRPAYAQVKQDLDDIASKGISFTRKAVSRLISAELISRRISIRSNYVDQEIQKLDARSEVDQFLEDIDKKTALEIERSLLDEHRARLASLEDRCRASGASFQKSTQDMLRRFDRMAIMLDYEIPPAVEFGTSAEKDKELPTATSNDATLTTSDIEDAVGILHDFVEESEKAEPYHVAEEIDGIQWEIIERVDEPQPEPEPEHVVEEIDGIQWEFIDQDDEPQSQPEPEHVVEEIDGIQWEIIEQDDEPQSEPEPEHVVEEIDGIQWEIIEQDDEPGPQSANTDHDTFDDSHGNLSTSREFTYDAEEDFLRSEEARWEMKQEINYPPEKGADDRLESVVTGVASSTNDIPTTENHVPKIYTIADFPGTYPFPFSSENETQRRLDAEHDWNTLTNTEIFRLVRENKFAAALCKGTAFHNELFNGTKLLSFEARRRGLDLETGKHDPKMATDPARATLFTDEELVTVDPTRKSKTRQRRDDFEL